MKSSSPLAQYPDSNPTTLQYNVQQLKRNHSVLYLDFRHPATVLSPRSSSRSLQSLPKWCYQVLSLEVELHPTVQPTLQHYNSWLPRPHPQVSSQMVTVYTYTVVFIRLFSGPRTYYNY